MELNPDLFVFVGILLFSASVISWVNYFFCVRKELGKIHEQMRHELQEVKKTMRDEIKEMKQAMEEESKMREELERRMKHEFIEQINEAISEERLETVHGLEKIKLVVTQLEDNARQAVEYIFKELRDYGDLVEKLEDRQENILSRLDGMKQNTSAQKKKKGTVRGPINAEEETSGNNTPMSGLKSCNTRDFYNLCECGMKRYIYFHVSKAKLILKCSGKDLVSSKTCSFEKTVTTLFKNQFDLDTETAALFKQDLLNEPRLKKLSRACDFLESADCDYIAKNLRTFLLDLEIIYKCPLPRTSLAF